MKVQQAFFLFFLMFSVAVSAGDGNISEKTEEKTEEQTNEDWMQALHQTVSNSVYQTAQWFDGFFVTNNEERKFPTTTAKIRVGWLPKSRDWNDVETRFRLRVKLPHFQDRLSLVLSDDTEDELENLPLESANVNPRSEDEKFSLALNYTEKKHKDRLMNYRPGISGGDIFLRAKHKRKFTINTKHKFLIEPSAYYYIDDGFGAKLLLEYDYQLHNNSLFRINYSIRKSQAFDHIRWKHGVYKLNQLDDKTASIWSFQAEGVRGGDRGYVVDKYTLGYRYRFNALADWLYFEVEPFVEFPEQENYNTTPGIALRVEGFFNKG